MSSVLPILVPLAVGFGAVGYATMAPWSTLWGPVIARGKVSSSQYALTFDDGPSEGSTDRILDLLGELDVKATFFAIGANVVASPKLLERMHREGHVIGNHSFDHSWLGGFRSRVYWRDQLRRTDEVIEQIIGVRPALFRPPLGVRTWRIMSAARQTGHRVITWTRVGFDGKFPHTDRILNRLSSAQPGDILLLHDGAEPNKTRDQSATVAAIKPLVIRLRERGLAAVRLDELAETPAYQSPDSHRAASAL